MLNWELGEIGECCIDFGMRMSVGINATRQSSHAWVFKLLLGGGWWQVTRNVLCPHVEEGPNLIKFLDNLAHGLPLYVLKVISLVPLEKRHTPPSVKAKDSTPTPTDLRLLSWMLSLLSSKLSLFPFFSFLFFYLFWNCLHRGASFNNLDMSEGTVIEHRCNITLRTAASPSLCFSVVFYWDAICRWCRVTGNFNASTLM